MRLAPELVERFAAAADIIREPEQLRTYECDGLTGRRVFPRSSRSRPTRQEVQAVVRICNDASIPFVARGAGTGLSGGALPVAEGIVISLARMNRVLSIDLDRGEVVVEPGVDESRRDARRFGRRLLLRARPVVAAGVHDRRQRRRELGRRALPEVRLHRQPRARRRDRAARRRTGRALGLGRRPRSARPVRRLRGDARDRDEADAARPAGSGSGVDAARRVRAHRRSRCRRLGNDRRGHPPCRDRDDGCDHDRGRGGCGRGRLSARLRRSADHRARRAAGRRSTTTSRSSRSSAGKPAPSRSASPPIRPTGPPCGGDERPRSPRWAASAPTTTCRTASSRARRLPEVLRRIDELSREHELRVGNVFHAGDGNLHPLVLYDAPHRRRRPSAPSCSRAASSKRASRRAARSPASTESAPTRPARCR